MPIDLDKMKKDREEIFEKEQRERYQRELEKEMAEKAAKDLQMKRQQIELELWGTPEVAYKTWEKRARAFVDMVNHCEVEATKIAEQLKKENMHRSFPVYRYISKYHYPSIIRFFIENGNVLAGTVRIDDFDFVLEGMKISIYPKVLKYERDGRLNCISRGSQCQNTYISPSARLCGPYRQEDYLHADEGFYQIAFNIFQNMAIVKLINEGGFFQNPIIGDTVKKFADLGNNLRDTPNDKYSYESCYNKESSIDFYTKLDFAGMKYGNYVTVYNHSFWNSEKVFEELRRCVIDHYPEPVDRGGHF